MGEFGRRIRRFSNDKELNAESLGGHVVKSFVMVDDDKLKYLFKSKRSENAEALLVFKNTKRKNIYPRIQSSVVLTKFIT